MSRIQTKKEFTYNNKKIVIYANELNNNLISVEASYVDEIGLSGNKVPFAEKIYRLNNGTVDMNCLNECIEMYYEIIGNLDLRKQK